MVNLHPREEGMDSGREFIGKLRVLYIIDVKIVQSYEGKFGNFYLIINAFIL